MSENRPREWWVMPETDVAFCLPSGYSGEVHVIEYSAYEELLTKLEMARLVLGKLAVQIEVIYQAMAPDKAKGGEGK